jgi:hypothetical protein
VEQGFYVPWEYNIPYKAIINPYKASMCCEYRVSEWVSELASLRLDKLIKLLPLRAQETPKPSQPFIQNTTLRLRGRGAVRGPAGLRVGDQTSLFGKTDRFLELFRLALQEISLGPPPGDAMSREAVCGAGVGGGGGHFRAISGRF